MAKLKATTYKDLDKMMGENQRMIIGNNTEARRSAPYMITINLHGHHIVTLFSEGTMRFTLAGWGTPTTRDRVNQFLPNKYGVSQCKHVQWYNGPDGLVKLDSNEWVEVD